MLKNAVLILIFMVISSVGMFAEGHGEKPQLVEGIVHRHHSHHAGFFTGVTSNLETKYNDFSIGVDYEYRLPVLKNIFGIGLMGEAVFGYETEYIAGIPVYVHLTDIIRIFAAPSLLYVPGPGGEPAAAKDELNKIQSAESASHTEYITVAGLFIDIQAHDFTLSPTLKFEFIGGHVSIAYGLTFAKGF